jgi:hypothetical protein
MHPLKAYLYAQDDSSTWTCLSFRDLEPLVDAVASMHQNQTKALAIHVGFWRPATTTVSELLRSHPGRVLISKAAIGTFPKTVKASAHGIGMAEDMEFYVVIDGFGFEINDPTSAKTYAPPVSGTSSEIITSGPLKLRGWVSALASSKPVLLTELLACGIWDEDSYLERESELPIEIRHQVGLDRFFILAAERPNPNTIIDKLNFAPPWFLDIGVHWLNLSVRSENVCRVNDIGAVKDFLKFGLKGLYKLPNLGQKSVFEMSLALVDLLNSGRSLIEQAQITSPIDSTTSLFAQDTSNKAIQALPKELDLDLIKDKPNQSKRTQPVVTFSDVVSGFMDAAKRLTDDEREVWAARIGFRCKAMTLQEIAVQINLSRERIRQIETKIYRRLEGHPFWTEFSNRVLAHLKNRTSPLYIKGLPAVDPWFKEVDDIAYAVGQVCEHISNLGFYVFSIGDFEVISQLSRSEWLGAVDNGKALLKVLVDQQPTESIARFQIESSLFDKGQELKGSLWREVSGIGLWADDGAGDRKLVGFGKTAQAIILGILERSDAPLRVDDIWAKVNEISTDTYNINSIRSIASDVGFLFGRGTYGLRKHCPLTSVELQTIRSEAEDIMAGSGPQKQWHSNEIFDELLDRGFDFEGRLTKYIVNIALDESTRFVYLRRMIYGLKGQWSDSAESRLDVKQAVCALLDESGHPLTTEEIRQGLAKARGVNVHFQISPSSPLIRIRPGVWGLEHRDVHIPDAPKLVLKLLKDLSYRQAGLHISEVAKFLVLSHEDDVALIVSLGQKDGLRIDKGQYCYLQPWGESRRISVQDATVAILKSYPEGLPLSELHSMVERETKRMVPRTNLSTVLQNIDASFYPTTGLWKLSGTSDEEAVHEGTGGPSFSLSQ